jgi:hypothetical protein
LGFRDELEALIRVELEESESLRRVLTSTEDSASHDFEVDDLVYVVADVLGALREALLRIGEEIDLMREQIQRGHGRSTLNG